MNADWILERMVAEREFYATVDKSRSDAKTEANNQDVTADHDVGANPAIDGLTQGDTGAAKALARALAVRDSAFDGTVTDNAAQNPVNLKGSAWYLPNARTQVV